MPFQVVLHPRQAAAVLDRLPRADATRIRAGLRRLADDPFTPHPGADIRRLSTDEEDPVLRLRVGEYRCVYVVTRREVRVVRIFHRSEGYGWMGRLGLD